MFDIWCIAEIGNNLQAVFFGSTLLCFYLCRDTFCWSHGNTCLPLGKHCEDFHSLFVFKVEFMAWHDVFIFPCGAIVHSPLLIVHLQGICHSLTIVSASSNSSCLQCFVPFATVLLNLCNSLLSAWLTCGPFWNRGSNMPTASFLRLVNSLNSTASNFVAFWSAKDMSLSSAPGQIEVTCFPTAQVPCLPCFVPGCVQESFSFFGTQWKTSIFVTTCNKLSCKMTVVYSEMDILPWWSISWSVVHFFWATLHSIHALCSAFCLLETRLPCRKKRHLSPQKIVEVQKWAQPLKKHPEHTKQGTDEE